MSFAADAFTGADTTELNAYDAAWVRHSSYTGDTLTIESNRVRCASNATAGSLYYNTASPASADYSVSCDVRAESTSAAFRAGPVGRLNAAADTYYLAGLDTGSTPAGLVLYKVISGTLTQLSGSPSSQTITAGNTYKVTLKMEGDQISAYLNDVLTIGPVTDTAITAAGKAGIRVRGGASSGVGFRADNFDAVDIAGGVTITCALGTASATGLQATVASAIELVCALGAAAALGYQATVSTASTVEGALGTATAGGYQATIGAGDTVICALGTTIASGYQATVGSPIDISGALGTATAAGYQATILVAGVIVTDPLKNNTGTVLASETGITAYVYETTGAHVVTLSSQTTDGSGVLTLTNAAISAGTTYRVIIVLSSSREGMTKKAAI